MFSLMNKACLENADRMTDQILEQAVCYLALTRKEQMNLRIICEEILVNIARYAYDVPGDMTVVMEYDGREEELRLCFMDRGIMFNPLERETPDLTATADERPIGGLGIHMVRKLADTVTYEREDGMNKLTVIKRYEK